MASVNRDRAELGRPPSSITSHEGGSHSHEIDDAHRIYAETESEDERDASGKKKRKRRRKANEPPRDAAMRKFVCAAEGCGKSFAR